MFHTGDERLKNDPFSLKRVAVSRREMDYETKIEMCAERQRHPP